MTMADIRKVHSVPAKRGMRVVINVGGFTGRLGYIRGSNRDGWLDVADVLSGRPSWRGTYHPTSLTYGPHGFIRTQQAAGRWGYIPATDQQQVTEHLS